MFRVNYNCDIKLTIINNIRISVPYVILQLCIIFSLK